MPNSPNSKPRKVALAAVVAVVLFLIGAGTILMTTLALLQRAEVVRSQRFDMPASQVTVFVQGASGQLGWKAPAEPDGAYTTGYGPLRVKIANDEGMAKVDISGPRKPADDLFELLKRQLPTAPRPETASP
jgi:hypothetical protein